jgi:hypothetical protein
VSFASRDSTFPGDLTLIVGEAFLFGGLSTLGLVACYFLVPETKARTFAELDELFEKRIPARHFAKFKTQVQLEVESAAMTGKDVEA